MWLKQKLGVENADNLFTRHGFVKRKDFRRKVCVSVNGDTTSPCRTYYEGLMKEPFRFCYPFDKKVVIETEEHDRLIFKIVKAGKSL